jgi:hypothetical protein
MPFALKRRFTGKNFYNKLRRGLGVEIEIADWKALEDVLFYNDKYVELVQSLNAKKLWDRSVIPSNHELVVGPLYGDAFLSNMSKLINVLLKEDVTINDSCSVHTHIDARDISIWGVRSAVLNYMRHESDFITMFSCKRIYNDTHRYGGFAKPFKATPHTYAKLQALKDVRTAGQIKNILIDYLYNIKNPSANFMQVVEKKSHKYESCRYYGFNLHAFMMMGTFEFRQMEGCIDSTLIMWPLFCGHYTQAIVKYSRSTLPFLEFCEYYLPAHFVKWAAARIDKYKDEWKIYNANLKEIAANKKESAARLIQERQPRRRQPTARMTTFDQPITVPEWPLSPRSLSIPNRPPASPATAEVVERLRGTEQPIAINTNLQSFNHNLQARARRYQSSFSADYNNSTNVTPAPIDNTTNYDIPTAEPA